MQKSYVLFIALFLTVSISIYAQSKKLNYQKSNDNFNSTAPASVAADSNVIWSENWEGSGDNWTPIDETDIGIKWHLDSFNAYGGSGLSWWMGDTTVGSGAGGYDNHWYQVLDTYPIMLPDSTSPMLTFYHRYKVEAPGGETAPYNGWDGINVRISTDSGATWQILENPTPAYNATALYSFGFEFGEGDTIPGWGGAQTTWTKVTFDLTAYTAKSVQIRFAFASDPGYSTPDDGTMFGWQIDSILVSNGSNVLYSNDGSEDEIVPSNFAPVGGDLWRISTGTGLPSGTHFAEVNDSVTASYNPNMINSLISDYFYLSDTVTTAYFDFFLQGSFSDGDVFPEVDYWGVYFQKYGETAWRYLSNITQDPNASNFVYSDAPANWARFSQTYTTGLVDIAPLKGDSIRIKITWFSDEDSPDGTALQIDKLVVYSPKLPTGIESDMNVPKAYNLAQNYPNPFNPSTSIKFSVPVKSDVIIKLYNILGSEIKELVKNSFTAGEHTIDFNAANLSSGVYFYSIKAVGENGKTFTQTKKLTLMK